MNIQELKELSHEINTQDNLCTAHPFYIVQQKKRIYNVEGSDDVVWLFDGEEIREDLSKELTKQYENGEYISTRCELVGYVDYWEFVTGCFTRKGAEDYIAVNGHNLTEPRIYVESLYRNREVTYPRLKSVVSFLYFYGITCLKIVK